MVIFTQKEALIQALNLSNPETGEAEKKSKIGFVPTMGALHSGHISLIARAILENEIVVVSIFVNPTQFNNASDLEKYPRTPSQDLSLLENFNNKLLVYLPEISDLYGDDIVAKNYNFGGLENEMEGKHRNGHFDGVGTVLNSFFRIINPDKAYFGEKDFQQLLIVKKLVAIEGLPIEIVGCPILREESGLAMSSRNERLSSEQKKEAVLIYKTLKEVKEKFHLLSIPELNQLVAERFLQNPEIDLEYFEIADEQNLKNAQSKNKNTRYRAFIAAFMGDVRLIDNMPLN
ncbi:MAG TPA: pantoate--beta-alanine ligase [Aequorivita sp.]|nr:pantoate--beta-alanine ligase [Aequorivita sp.]